MYIIRDNVTGEVLRKYDPNPDQWNWEGFENLLSEFDAHVFETKKAASSAKKHLEDEFSDGGETEIDFEILKVQKEVHYRVRE